MLHKTFNGIFNAGFFKIKNDEQNKKVKKRGKNKKNVFYIYAIGLPFHKVNLPLTSMLVREFWKSFSATGKINLV